MKRCFQKHGSNYSISSRINDPHCRSIIPTGVRYTPRIIGSCSMNCWTTILSTGGNYPPTRDMTQIFSETP